MITTLHKKRERHEKRRDQIAETIEKKQRELDFLQGLTSDDVIFMMRKKQQYAAKRIQRAWRKKKLRTLLTHEGRRKFRELRAAMVLQRYVRQWR